MIQKENSIVKKKGGNVKRKRERKRERKIDRNRGKLLY